MDGDGGRKTKTSAGTCTITIPAMDVLPLLLTQELDPAWAPWMATGNGGG
jgi:hypothetical protein